MRHSNIEPPIYLQPNEIGFFFQALIFAYMLRKYSFADRKVNSIELTGKFSKNLTSPDLVSFCNLLSIFIRVNPNRIIRIFQSYIDLCVSAFASLHMVSDKCLTMNYPYASHRFPQIFNPVIL